MPPVSLLNASEWTEESPGEIHVCRSFGTSNECHMKSTVMYIATFSQPELVSNLTSFPYDAHSLGIEIGVARFGCYKGCEVSPCSKGDDPHSVNTYPNGFSRMSAQPLPSYLLGTDLRVTISDCQIDEASRSPHGDEPARKAQVVLVEVMANASTTT